jgi:hypothetical protein
MTLHNAACSLFALAITMGLAAPAQATDLSGSWAGSWQSCTTGHSGVLRATFTKCSETQYRVEFTGRFCKILPFRYSVTLDVVEESGESVKLAGSSYLGRLFGTFCYTAAADGCSFTAHYSSKKDQGQFVMRRVDP